MEGDVCRAEQKLLGDKTDRVWKARKSGVFESSKWLGQKGGGKGLNSFEAGGGGGWGGERGAKGG